MNENKLVGSPERQKDVPEQMDRLTKIISSVYEITEELEILFAPLIRYNTLVLGEKADAESEVLEPICNHADRIRSCVHDLESIYDKLKYYRNGLEI